MATEGPHRSHAIWLASRALLLMTNSRVSFTGFNDLLQQLESCADNLVTEYLERKLEDCVSILFGMICQ